MGQENKEYRDLKSDCTLHLSHLLLLVATWIKPRSQMKSKKLRWGGQRSTSREWAPCWPGTFMVSCPGLKASLATGWFHRDVSPPNQYSPYYQGHSQTCAEQQKTSLPTGTVQLKWTKWPTTCLLFQLWFCGQWVSFSWSIYCHIFYCIFVIFVDFAV